ncbi:hypothetical protein Thein_1565 [Thermodesulfatator indicus DSM 15286]|uniref:Phosphate-starvation-inducible E-like protein n=1 Tax=Thermodesulfatator indicus (strain DSM 15286 / JCM 11887 / CIR29812) TaxID=667014 RepID=F8AAK0_THEID|nr:phosphate-starvation-inducible PsiE family protein [Thermodesulfatator indicus]AEH45426.1 hypothetical protein Thein_1565 [Thermodesulfatator indicus DSM 15286]
MTKPRRSWLDILFQEQFLKVERFLYILVAVLILIASAVVIGDGALALYHLLVDAHDFTHGILKVMDRFLLALMFLEILHTVQIIFGEEHHLACVEPFIMVAIIASVRRLLILSFEISHAGQIPLERLKFYLMEMLIIGFLIICLVTAVIFLRRSRERRRQG